MITYLGDVFGSFVAYTVPVVVLLDPDEYVFGLVPVISNSSADFDCVKLSHAMSVFV